MRRFKLDWFWAYSAIGSTIVVTSGLQFGFAGVTVATLGFSCVNIAIVIYNMAQAERAWRRLDHTLREYDQLQYRQQGHVRKESP